MTKNEAEELIRRQISGGLIWFDRNAIDKCEGLEWALEGSEFEGADRDAMVMACAKLITDPDIGVRSGIVRVLRSFTPDLGAEWLTTVLETHPELYAGVKPVGTKLLQPDLEKEILLTIASLIKPGDTRSVLLLRKTAHDPACGYHVQSALSKVDSEWLCEHTELIHHGNIAIFINLSSNQREQVVRAKAPWPDNVVNSIASERWSRSYPEISRHLLELFRTAR